MERTAMSDYLPDGCTDYDVDFAAGGYDDPEPEDPENEYPLVPCKRCHNFPCRCVRDEMDAEDDAVFEIATEEDCRF